MFISFFFLFFFLSSVTQSQDVQKNLTALKSQHKNPLHLKKKSSKGLHLKPFPVIYNREVRKWAYHFSRTYSHYMELWLKRSYRYFPLMKDILSSRGLPKELLAMTLVESNLSSKAVSTAQAVGYWQFIKPTGLRFGLRIDDWIDERQDFQKSTQAATKYLYQLYEEFGDWLLSMSAYNMGEARLRRLIKKHKTRNFWLLYKKPDFPRETASYVPKVLAASYIIKRPEFYGLSEFQVLAPYRYDLFYVSGGTSLKQISKVAKVPFSKLKSLNPDLKKHYIPKSISSHFIRIPEGSGALISKWLDKQKKSH